MCIQLLLMMKISSFTVIIFEVTIITNLVIQIDFIKI